MKGSVSPGSALCRSLYSGSKRTFHFFQTHWMQPGLLGGVPVHGSGVEQDDI